jgi:hypothetical protein
MAAAEAAAAAPGAVLELPRRLAQQD